MTARQLVARRPVVAQSLSFATARSGLLQRKCACGGTPVAAGECGECTKRLQRRVRDSGLTTRNDPVAPPIVREVLRSPGQPLDSATRAFFEPRFGYDFSDIRVHTDARAAESAGAVNALAYTVGMHVVFGAAQYAPSASWGRKLLAHELTHTIQQGPPASQAAADLTTTTPAAGAEKQAEKVGNAIANGRSIAAVSRHPRHLARKSAGAGGSQVSERLSGPQITPVPGSPYAALPVELRETLLESFENRLLGVPGSNDNLANAFWGGGYPRDLWDALDRIGTADIAALVQAYERVAAIGAWNHVRTIGKVWTGPSRGFQFAVQDLIGLVTTLNRSDRMCKDTGVGQSMHQRPTPQECWREIIGGSPGLHVCLDKRGSGVGTSHEIHIDLHQTVLGKKPITGVCEYDINPFGVWGKHMGDTIAGHTPSVFERYERVRTEVTNLYKSTLSGSPLHRELSPIQALLDQRAPLIRQEALRGVHGELETERRAAGLLMQIEHTLKRIHGRRLDDTPRGLPF